MSKQNAIAFHKLLRESRDLQRELRSAAVGFLGNLTDDRTLFETVVAPVAKAAGVPFTYDEAATALTDGHELSEEELDAVAGGTGTYCQRLIDGVLAES